MATRRNNPENERIKHEYLSWLRNAQTRSEATIDIAAAAIHRFEAHSGYRNFKSFRREQAISFKGYLASQRHETTGKPLAAATIYSTLNAVRAFFEWLSHQPGYRRTVQYSDAAYFKPSANEARTATAVRQRGAPSVEQVRHVVTSMPTATVQDRRNRALVSLIMLTGARDAAVASLRLKHLDLGNRTLLQDPREVSTKRAKSIPTVFFPVGDDFEAIVVAWENELRTEQRFGPDDPLFPATRMTLDADGHFAADGIERRFWTSAGPIRELFRHAFEAAGLPYHNPHSLRRTLMRLAYELNLTHRQIKAWSQNLGHESVITSIVSYGTLSFHEQADVMGELATAAADPDAEVMEIARRIMAMARPTQAA
jgi:integrase